MPAAEGEEKTDRGKGRLCPPRDEEGGGKEGGLVGSDTGRGKQEKSRCQCGINSMLEGRKEGRRTEKASRGIIKVPFHGWSWRLPEEKKSVMVQEGKTQGRQLSKGNRFPHSLTCYGPCETLPQSLKRGLLKEQRRGASLSFQSERTLRKHTIRSADAWRG